MKKIKIEKDKDNEFYVSMLTKLATWERGVISTLLKYNLPFEVKERPIRRAGYIKKVRVYNFYDVLNRLKQTKVQNSNQKIVDKALEQMRGWM